MIIFPKMDTFNMGKASSIVACRLTGYQPKRKPPHKKLKIEHNNPSHGRTQNVVPSL